MQTSNSKTTVARICVASYRTDEVVRVATADDIARAKQRPGAATFEYTDGVDGYLVQIEHDEQGNEFFSALDANEISAL